jgi:two-component system, OmpR family, sensor histidine kinase KdpD
LILAGVEGGGHGALHPMAFVPQDYAVRMPTHWVELLLISGLVGLQTLVIIILARGRRAGSSSQLIEAQVVLPECAEIAPNPLEGDQICTFISETTKLDPRRKPGPQLAALVHSIFPVESVAIFDADLEEVYKSGEWSEDVLDVLENICIFETASDDPETGLSRRVVRMGNLPIGAMLIRGEARGRMASTIASVVAITFDRYHAFANESRTESARQTEQLRTTVLDSLAHAYKTPLTAISAASEGLSAMGSLTPAQSGMVALIEEQTSLLSRLTTRLLKTARLNASDMKPHVEKVAISPLIEDVVASHREQLASVSVKIAVSREDLSIACDRSLLVALLTQFVDNAAKYSSPGTAVTIGAAEHAAEVVFSVQSFGPVIPSTDFQRIFDRYYRSSFSTNKVPGTGIGLSVAKRAAQAQGGYVWVTSDNEKGTTFYASLPTVSSPIVPQGVVRS